MRVSVKGCRSGGVGQGVSVMAGKWCLFGVNLMLVDIVQFVIVSETIQDPKPLCMVDVLPRVHITNNHPVEGPP